MICNECGVEFGGESCPACLWRPEDAACLTWEVEPVKQKEVTIQEMLKSTGVGMESGDAARLRREKCQKCLKQLNCGIIRKAKQAKPGQLIAGLYISRAYIAGAWQSLLGCRAFVHIPSKAYRRRKVEAAEYVGDLFQKKEVME
jgi:hypothetical protein